MLTVYLRYRQIAELYRSHSARSNVNRANKASVIVGFISAAGMSLVANFQETNVISVHLVGALLAFGGATIYLWLQVGRFFFITSHDVGYISWISVNLLRGKVSDVKFYSFSKFITMNI